MPPNLLNSTENVDGVVIVVSDETIASNLSAQVPEANNFGLGLYAMPKEWNPRDWLSG